MQGIPTFNSQTDARGIEKTKSQDSLGHKSKMKPSADGRTQKHTGNMNISPKRYCNCNK